MAHLIPWDEICNLYLQFVPKGQTGRPTLNPRIVIGSIIIKHMCNLDDRETVDQISENIYMQYFLGYPSFTNEKPFDASLFVAFRKRLVLENVNLINEKIARKRYLQTAQKKNKSRKVSRKANRCHLNYVRRDIAFFNKLLDLYQTNNLKFPLNPKQQKYLWVIQTLYDQQAQMYDTNTYSVDHRIVSIHQPQQGTGKSRIWLQNPRINH